MAIMDAGLFFILLGIAFVSLLVSFKMGSAFKLLGGVLFFVLGLVMMADYDVAYAQNTVLGNGTLAETKTTYIIGDGNDTGDFEPNNQTESVKTVASSEAEEVEEVEDLLPPNIFEPSWSDYVLSKFESDEMVDGNPTVDGLRRVTELVMGGITASTTEVIQVPTKENKGRATAIHTVSVIMPDGISRTVSGSGDAWYKNTDMPYSKFPVAMAETRAEGRALRRLLQLRKVVSAEELSQNLDEELDYGNELINYGV